MLLKNKKKKFIIVQQALNYASLWVKQHFANVFHVFNSTLGWDLIVPKHISEFRGNFSLQNSLLCEDPPTPFRIITPNYLWVQLLESSITAVQTFVFFWGDICFYYLTHSGVEHQYTSIYQYVLIQISHVNGFSEHKPRRNETV